ncbi:SET domain-containing protein [Rouxiella badensis]|uniref:SET domain-containing protein n=1 Tax=Rouxiella badensis TaxID=1646377 RepID=UPI001CE48409|nr:SET domain-containing protein [Rouxiella badensis]
MSDFSILPNPGTSIISSSSMPMSRPDPQSFLNNITHVSQSTEVTCSQGPACLPSSRKSKIGNEQTTFINNLIQQSGCANNVVEAARVWLDNKQELEALHISRGTLAELCSVPQKELFARIGKLAVLSKLAKIKLSDEQQSMITRISDATGCRRNRALTSVAWEKNKTQLLNNNIDVKLFASRCDVNPLSLVCYISQKKRCWKRLDSNIRQQVDKLINTAGCKGVPSLASEVWYENKKTLKQLGVSNMVFCFRCGVKTLAINTDLSMLNYVPPSKEPDFTPQQRAQVDKIIEATSCLSNPVLAANAWVKNLQLMSEMNIRQEAFANASRVNATDLFIKIQKERARTRALTETQHALLNRIAVKTRCWHSSTKSACAWLDNEQSIIKEDIWPINFAEFCGINLDTFGWRIARERRDRVIPTSAQLRVTEEIILAENSGGKPLETAQAWDKNKKSLLDAGLTAWQFEYASKVCSGTISSRISCVYRPRKKGQKTPQWRLLHEKRLQEQQQVMDAIILSSNCRKNLNKSTLAWIENQQNLADLKISKVQFSRRCNINPQSLTSSVSRLRKNNGSCPPRSAQYLPPVPPTGIKTGLAAVRAQLGRVDRPSINNSLPILRHPDNPQHSLTLETLGLDVNANVSQIRVTHWGSMEQVFARLPILGRLKLKSRLFIELHRQLLDERGQSKPMSTLMSNAGEHRLANGEDGIINLDTGVVNPGPAPVPINTVLGFYAGLLLDSATSQKRVRQTGATELSIDAFQGGNILRNINTGRLPGEPPLAENNVAAVQVNSRLIAYITTRDIAAGEEYFVDYGVHYNPLFGIEKARQIQLAAGRL